MSSSNRIVAVKRGSLLVAALAVVLAAGAVIQTVLRIDAYAALKATSKSVDPNLGVRIEGVTIKSYEKDKLVLKANMDRLDVRQDKQHYDLFGVKDGVFYSKKEALEFDAPKAQWNVQAHELEAPDGGHIKGKEADLQVPQFAFNSKTGVMNTLGPVKGKLSGKIKGNIEAKGVRYDINKGSIRTGPISFAGTFSGFQEAGQTSQRRWKLAGELMESEGDTRIYTKGEATDGDIWVFADRIEQNVKTDIIIATGHVKYISVKTNMACDKAVIDRAKKVATLTENVTMLLKAKEKQVAIKSDEGIPPFRPIVPAEIAKTRPQAEIDGPTAEQKKLDDEIRSSRNIRDYPTVCYADKVVYWYGKDNKHAEISGKPQARQELRDGAWRQIWTNMAYYDGEKDTLKLVATPGKDDLRMIDSIGDDSTAETLIVSTEEGNDKIWATKVRATVPDYDNEIPKGDKPKTATTGGGGGQGTPPPKQKPPLSGGIGGKKGG
jgi:hypothetical protein